MAATRPCVSAGRRAWRDATRGARIGEILAFLFCALAIAGCAAPDFLVGMRTLYDRIAAEAGWTATQYAAGPFSLMAYEHFTRPGDDLTVYIESDGTAWLGRHTLSADPTPAQPVMMRMAVQDPAPNMLYLARPCQFLDADALRRCSPAYWSSARFAPEVIAGYQAALDRARRASGARRLTLVGYSGGGAIAALVAAGRDDVDLLVTVAGTLDHATWTRDAGVSPLDRSLNPPNFADRLRAIAQVHFVGDRDDVVPRAVTQAYLSRLGDARRVRVVTLPGYDHDCCWVRNWRTLLTQNTGAGF